ncbi:stage II sporulation protein R [Cellulosilyticum sp. I15G10I2]|uniref:stage II sporulation protein R n=1 Tax=Cellulosilyticum sp. I15G10I2 TaxID=1892843 RepID=UPI00085CDD6F|nr:stage II sporulation protein R [Cellulosilyticum sp. I15G10I2]
MKNIIRQYLFQVFQTKNYKKFLYIVFIVVCLLTICKVTIGTYTHSVTEAISDKVIRFHVVANSDTTADQLLKQQVRDEVIAYMEPMLKESTSIDETRMLVKKNLFNIEEIAKKVVKKWDKQYKVYVALDYANFPTKAYGDVVLPAGEYEACRIIIGEGKGQNWWCVMFPPLCYIDAASGVVPLEGKDQLKKELNEEQYNLIAHKKGSPYQVRFKIVDTINSYLDKPNYNQIPKKK